MLLDKSGKQKLTCVRWHEKFLKMLWLNLYFLWLLKKLMTALHFMEVKYMCLSHRPGINFLHLAVCHPWWGFESQCSNLKFSRLSFHNCKSCVYKSNNILCIYFFVTYFLILNKKESFTTSRINVMLQWSWSKICIYHMTWLQDNLKTQRFLNRDLWQVLLCCYIQLLL